jgi:hypothetical protein
MEYNEIEKIEWSEMKLSRMIPLFGYEIEWNEMEWKRRTKLKNKYFIPLVVRGEIHSIIFYSAPFHYFF